MNQKSKEALTIERKYTKEGLNPFNMFEYEYRDCSILAIQNKQNNNEPIYEVPKHWSKNATDILISKYFRKNGLDSSGKKDQGETSVKQVIHRMANCWRIWGSKYGYFSSEKDAQVFYEETVFSMLNQACVPNSPQWFNTGLYESYNLTGNAQGHYYVDPETQQLQKSTNAYERPQPHACFILSVKDDLVNEGGIMDLWTKEARIFKFGSGVGTNFSTIRGKGEKLSGGGTSSGLMSFLKIGDRAAGAIKSGGTTRRAAKMVCLDIDHPEIEEFIEWKAKEEEKAKVLIKSGYDNHYEGEAYTTISGQNSNNSVRITNEFLQALKQNKYWGLVARSNGQIMKTVKANDIWQKIAESAWICADPGVQFSTTINEWHTCPKGGKINASNPCSEYMFLDNTACNLASINLMRFFKPNDLNKFDVSGFEYTAKLWTIVLEISVLMAQFPSKEVAELSYQYRTLGLGFANLGTLLMACKLPYDSQEGRTLAAVITSIMTATAYKTSAEMAKCFGSFDKYKENASDMLRVINNHRQASKNNPNNFDGLDILPQCLDQELCPQYLFERASIIWDEAYELGKIYGFRNAQTTVIAPTGTIGLVMDCDTMGVEPEFALVKMKKLAGGGQMNIVNNSLQICLNQLGYAENQTAEIIAYIIGHKDLNQSPIINTQSLLKKGFDIEDIKVLTAKCPTSFNINSLFSKANLGLKTYKKLNFSEENYTSSKFNLLVELGFTSKEIKEADEYIFGHKMIEGAPYLKNEHLPIFDCASKNGNNGQRFIHYNGHIDMLAACQPYISGAISKTINMPENTSVEEVKESYIRSWEKGLKACALYRENCKISQPLNTQSDEAKSQLSNATNLNTDLNVTFNQPKKNTAKIVDLSQISTDHLLEEINNRLLASKDTKLKHQLSSIIQRKTLPQKRPGYNHKIKILGEQVVFLKTGEYDDGTLGEIFIDLAKQGSTLAGLTHCFAIAVSIGLQYGVPLQEFVDKFVNTKFEPRGFTDHSDVKNVTSIADLVFRILAIDYLGRKEFSHTQSNLNQNKTNQQNVNKSSVYLTPQDLSKQDGFAEMEYNQLNKDLGESTKDIFGNLENNPIIPKAISPQHSVNNYQNVNKNYHTGEHRTCTMCGCDTKPNGTCFICLNCGTTTGCS